MNKLLSLIFLSVSFSAWGINLQSYRFSDSYRYSIIEDSYQEKFKGKYVLSTSLGFVNSPFYVSDKDVTRLESEIIHHQYLFTAGASYYYSHQLVLGLDMNALRSDVLDETKTSLGDTILKARWNLYRANDLSFSLNPKLYLPTGQTDNFSTVNSLAGSLSGVGEYRLNDWHFLGSIGFFHGGNNKFSIVDYRNLVLLNVGASYDLNSLWNINAEAVKNFTTNRAYRQDEGDYYLTFKYKAHPKAGLYFGAGMAGLEEVDRNNYSVFVGLKFHQ